MASSLTGIGTVTYNGFTFNGPRVRSELSFEPVYDETGRSVTCYLGRITVEAYITSDTAGQGGGTTTPSAVVSDMRARLTKAGGALIYDGLGHGSFRVNTTSTNRDVKFGPKPRLIRFNPIPGLTTFEVLWVCEFWVLECDASSFAGTVGKVNSYGYGVDYQIDRAGLTTRLVAGHITMNLNRTSAGSTSIPNTADELVGDISVTVPFGFQRESSSRKLSADKTRLDFAIVDKEQPSINAYPPDVVDMSLSHRVSTSMSRGFGIHLSNVISGFIEVHKEASISDAFTRVIQIIRDRVTIGIDNTGEAGLPTGVSITESIYGPRRVNFSFSYTLFSAGFDRIVGNSGLFTEIDSTSHNLWSQSLIGAVWDMRGTAGLAHLSNNDSVITACDDTSVPEIDDTWVSYFNYGSPAVMSFECPDRDKSYIISDSNVEVHSSSDVAGHLPYRESDSLPSRGTLEANDEAVLLPSAPSSNTVILQDLSDGMFVELWLRGYAVRACYFPEVPSIVGDINSFVSTDIRPYETKVVNTKLAEVSGKPIYASKWTIKYKTSFTNVSDLSTLIGNMEDIIVVTDQDQAGLKKRAFNQ